MSLVLVFILKKYQNLTFSFEGKDKYNLCKHLGDADFCGQVNPKYADLIESYSKKLIKVDALCPCKI